jgi:hypothetical protein
MKSFILFLTITATANAENISITPGTGTLSMTGAPALAAPELNGDHLAGALTLLAGGLLILAARHRKQK